MSRYPSLPTVALHCEVGAARVATQPIRGTRRLPVVQHGRGKVNERQTKERLSKGLSVSIQFGKRWRHTGRPDLDLKWGLLASRTADESG